MKKDGTISIHSFFHDRLNPIFYSRPSRKKRHFDILQMANDCLEDFYYSPCDYLEHLRYSRTSDRQQRSEAREAIVRLLQVALDHLDVGTMTLRQYFPNGKFLPLSLDKLASLANLGRKRAHRALAALKRAGYVEVHHRFHTRRDGSKVPLRAIKKINLSLFSHLGICLKKVKQCIRFSKNESECKTEAAKKGEWKFKTLMKKPVEGSQSTTLITHAVERLSECFKIP